MPAATGRAKADDRALGSRRDKARTRSRATRLITAAGLREPRWQPCYAVIIQSVTAVK
ncbi:MAG: hypothetical protein ABSA02_33405 [Trebonia sp.]